MNKNFTRAFLASTVVGLTSMSIAQAATQITAAPVETTNKAADTQLGSSSKSLLANRKGLYITPNAEVIFVNGRYTSGAAAIGVGGGGGLAIGYQINRFQLELAASYHYYGGTGSTTQTYNAAGASSAGFAAILELPMEQRVDAIQKGFAIAGLSSSLNGKHLISSAKSNEGFIPITLGLNYSVPLNARGSLILTPGLAGGVWLHTIDRKISYRDDADGQLVGLGDSFASIFGGTKPTTDKGFEVKGVIVPSLSLDYALNENFTLRFAGKFYIVPGGYSENYASLNRSVAATRLSVASFTPAHTIVNQNFWYGGLSVGGQYSF